MLSASLFGSIITWAALHRLVALQRIIPQNRLLAGARPVHVTNHQDHTIALYANHAFLKWIITVLIHVTNQ